MLAPSLLPYLVSQDVSLAWVEVPVAVPSQHLLFGAEHAVHLR